MALLHQHQRPRGRHEQSGFLVEYVAVTLDDIALANKLAPEVLGRSLDELPPQTRRLLGHIRTLVKAKKGGTFSRRELHAAHGWSFTQLRVHLERLTEHEYLATRSGRMGSQFVYELLIDADAPEHLAHVPLLDVARLRQTHAYETNLAGLKPNLAGANGHLAGGDGVGARGVKCA
jgi:hypothetical protein